MPTFTRSLLAPALDKFLASAPGAEINVIEAYSGVLTEMTQKGRAGFRRGSGVRRCDRRIASAAGAGS